MKRFLALLFILLPVFVWGQGTKSGYVINIEKNSIYVDLCAPVVKNGTKLFVYANGGYMIHPVTKQKIKKEAETCAEIQIVGVYDGYSIAKLISGQISELKVGMIIKEKLLDVKVVYQQEEPSKNTITQPVLSSTPDISTKNDVTDKIRVIVSPAEQKAFITIGRNLDSFFNGNTNKKVMGNTNGFANNDQEMSAKGTRLYMGTERLDKDGMQLVFNENPDLYFQYKKGKKQVRMSWLPIVGGVMLGTVIMGQLGTWEDEAMMGVGGLVMVAGVGTGIYMQIAGKNKIKKVVRRYNSQQKHSYYNSCQLGFCLDDNGLGIRLIF